MKIYTKIGDKGTTRLVDGSCVDKFNPKVVAYGTVDELNAFLGQLIFTAQGTAFEASDAPTKKLSFFNESVISLKDLETIQHHLFRVGSCLATADESVLQKMPAINESHIAALEQKIDSMQSELPVLKKFILPGGNSISVQAHLCRTICRRAERETVAATVDLNPIYQDIRIYLNRLSDFFFVFARYANHITRTSETHWNQDL